MPGQVSGVLATVGAGLRAHLFAPVAEPGPARRWAAVLAVLLGSASIPLSLVRQPGSALDDPWAEDGHLFLAAAYAHPLRSVLFVPYAGYASVYPRLVAAAAARVRIVDAPAVLALGGALACAVAVFFSVVATEGHVRSLGVRALLGAAVGLFPLAGFEVAASTCNAQWYFLAVAFWALLWHSRGPAGGLLAGLLLFLGASNDPLLGLLLPLAVLRVLALPRWRDNIAGLGLLLGLLAQLPSLRHPSLVAAAAHPSLRALAGSWLYRGPVAALFGPQLPAHLGRAAMVVGALVLGLAIVVTGVLRPRVPAGQGLPAGRDLPAGQGLPAAQGVPEAGGLPGPRGVWPALVATATGAVLFMVPAYLRWDPRMAALRPMDFASRYDLAPWLLSLTVLALAVDAVGARARLGGAALVAVLTLATVVIAVVALPVNHSRVPSWSRQLPGARARCRTLPAGATVELRQSPSKSWLTTVPCTFLIGHRA